MHELNGNQDSSLSSKERTIGQQDTSIESNEKMQVDEGAVLHATDKVTHTGSTTSLQNSHQPVLISNIGASPKPDPPKEAVIIPASPGESPSGIDVSQKSADTTLFEQVYQDLQQQFDEAKAKEQESKVLPSKQSSTIDKVLEKKTSSRKKLCESR